MHFYQNINFWGPNCVGGAWYGIFLIRGKPALRAGLITDTISLIHSKYIVTDNAMICVVLW